MNSGVLRTLVARGVLAALLIGLAGPSLAGSNGNHPQTRLVGVVNVNTATPEQLVLLPGIGPSRAQALIQYRKGHGAFQAVGDLVHVSGIGSGALERIRRHCVLEGKTTAALKH